MCFGDWLTSVVQFSHAIITVLQKYSDVFGLLVLCSPQCGRALPQRISHEQLSTSRPNATPSDVQTLQSLGSRLHAPGCVVGNYLMQENRSGNQQLNLNCLWLSMHDLSMIYSHILPNIIRESHPIKCSLFQHVQIIPRRALNFYSSSHITTSICSNAFSILIEGLLAEEARLRKDTKDVARPGHSAYTAIWLCKHQKWNISLISCC